MSNMLDYLKLFEELKRPTLELPVAEDRFVRRGVLHSQASFDCMMRKIVDDLQIVQLKNIKERAAVRMLKRTIRLGNGVLMVYNPNSFVFFVPSYVIEECGKEWHLGKFYELLAPYYSIPLRTVRTLRENRFIKLHQMRLDLLAQKAHPEVRRALAVLLKPHINLAAASLTL